VRASNSASRPVQLSGFHKRAIVFFIMHDSPARKGKLRKK
jgi:hypothetical protein